MCFSAKEEKGRNRTSGARAPIMAFVLDSASRPVPAFSHELPKAAERQSLCALRRDDDVRVFPSMMPFKNILRKK